MKKMISFGLLLTALFAIACTTSKNTGAATNGSSSTVDSNDITGKYWKLVTLEGKRVMMGAGQEKEAHITLKSGDSSFVGHGGCNSISGTYKLQEGNRIRFYNAATTLKACAGVQHESEFFEVLSLADNYTIHNDTLYLNKARRAPLAVLQAVYFQ